jgi:hypothetical protein
LTGRLSEVWQLVEHLDEKEEQAMVGRLNAGMACYLALQLVGEKESLTAGKLVQK